MQKVNKPVANKLCRLSSFLHHACEQFENVAKEIKDKKIRMSVRSVAIKTKQYMGELDSQLQMLRVACTQRRIKNREEINSTYVKNIPDKKIVQLCCDTEVYFEKAYRSILNEYFPFKPLRDMLRYQITGIYYAFRQLKLLNSVITIPHSPQLI